MFETQRSLVIGFSCNKKKRQSFFQPFGDYLARKGHHLLELEDIDSAPHCDVIIHKRTDDMAAAFQGDAIASSHIVLLQKFLQLESLNNTLIIDDMEAIWSVISRKGLLRKIDEIVVAVQSCPSLCRDSTHFLKKLWWLQVSKNAGRFQPMSFPLILKSLPACGVHKSHRMYLVRNERALEEILNTCFGKEESVIAQRLVSSSYIWKVYVIGDNVDIFCQPNLPLFYIKEELYKEQGWVCFDSQESLPETNYNGTILSPKETVPTILIDSLHHFIQPLIPIISQVLGLSLYGLDIILDEVDKHYYIVDINYFPSFRGVENCFDKIWAMIWKRLDSF